MTTQQQNIMKFFCNHFILRTGLVVTVACMLAACVTTTRSPNITIIEGVTLNQTVELPACENLEIRITNKQQVDIIGLDTIKTTCIYKHWETQRQIKGLPMALIAFPADQKPAFLSDNFMLALLSKENLLLRVQMDTQGTATQQETLRYLRGLLGEPSANQLATINNVWGATPQATLAAWNTDFIEAMFIGEIAVTHLGSFSITSKNIYQYTTDAAITYTPVEDEKDSNEQAQSALETPTETPQAKDEETPIQRALPPHPTANETKPVTQEKNQMKPSGKIKEESVLSTQTTQ